MNNDTEHRHGALLPNFAASSYNDEDQSKVDAWWRISPQGRRAFAHWKSMGERGSIRFSLECYLPSGGPCEYEYHVRPIFDAADDAVTRRRAGLEEELRSGLLVAHWSDDPAMEGWKAFSLEQWAELRLQHQLLLPRNVHEAMICPPLRTRLVRRTTPATGAMKLPRYVRVKPVQLESAAGPSTAIIELPVAVLPKITVAQIVKWFVTQSNIEENLGKDPRSKDDWCALAQNSLRCTPNAASEAFTEANKTGEGWLPKGAAKLKHRQRD